jgi:hypothetical protein
MNDARKVLLLQDREAPPADTHALGDALRRQGAQVRLLPLAPPYDELLDALADGWLPVLLNPSDRPKETDE